MFRRKKEPKRLPSSASAQAQAPLRSEEEELVKKTIGQQGRLYRILLLCLCLSAAPTLTVLFREHPVVLSSLSYESPSLPVAGSTKPRSVWVDETLQKLMLNGSSSSTTTSRGRGRTLAYPMVSREHLKEMEKRKHKYADPLEYDNCKAEDWQKGHRTVITNSSR